MGLAGFFFPNVEFGERIRDCEGKSLYYFNPLAYGLSEEAEQSVIEQRDYLLGDYMLNKVAASKNLYLLEDKAKGIKKH